MSKTTAVSAALLAAACVGVAARADQPGKAKAVSDQLFVKEAVRGGMAEVKLGQLAQEQASSSAVHKFARRMVEDHTNANAELKTIANANGVELPGAIDRKHQKLMDKLSKLSGGDFDREYMEHMVRDHKHDVREFRELAKAKEDSPVKAFAANTLPTLEGHLVMAQKTNDIALAAKRSGSREVGSKR